MTTNLDLAPINVTDDTRLSPVSTRIPIKRLPGDKIVSCPMDFSVTSSAYRPGIAAAFMERMASAFATQLHIPRSQVDIATTEGPSVPFATKRFIVLAHLIDNRIHTEEQAMQFYRHPPERPAVPEFIDI